MANEDMIDVTEERDVTEATIDHEVAESDVPPMTELEIPPEDQIEFYSMDGKVYLANAQAINWKETGMPESVQNIMNNLFIIRQRLRELMYNNIEDPLMASMGTEEAVKVAEESRKVLVDSTMDIVVPFLTGFGLIPEYNVVFPGIEGSNLAMLYCIDAIEVLTKILAEIRVRNAEAEPETESSEFTITGQSVTAEEV